MGRVLNDFQVAALRQAYELSIKYLVTPPDNASAAQSAMGEIVAALDDVVNYPNHVYSGPIQDNQNLAFHCGDEVFRILGFQRLSMLAISALPLMMELITRSSCGASTIISSFRKCLGLQEH